ncbi:MAG: hypothetical protein M1831_003386 [Alyxoria varia]|nr:MAG: hypothetical protein M1831_003386 [Alyxoria varia]
MGATSNYLGLRGSRLTAAICTICGLCFFLFGYDQGDLSGLLTVPSFREQFPQIDTIGYPTDRHVSMIQGAVVATWNAGCIISAVSALSFSAIIGRRKTILLGLTFLIIGETVQASAFSLGQLIAGRAVAGFGNGLNTAAVPVWLAETCRGHQRGTLIMITGTFVAAGVTLSYWVSFGFAYLESTSASWRIPIAFQLVVALPLLALVPVLPESPRWLLMQGRADEAVRVLSALSEKSRDDPIVYKEFLAIKDALLHPGPSGFSLAFKQGRTRHLHRTMLACLAQIFQQMSGINMVTQYIALILFTQFGVSDWVARLLASCIGTQGIVASLVPVVGIDKFWGRRSLMMFGAFGMSISMVVLTIMAYLEIRAGDIVAIVFFFVFNTFFVIGWQGMSWLYSVEIVPLRTRGPVSSLSTACNWLVNFAVAFATPIAFQDIGYRFYIVFAATNAFIVPVIYFFFPEASNRALEEIDCIFYAAGLSSNPAFTVVRDSRDAPLWYGENGSKEFDYEKSEWHQKHVHWSDESSASSEDSNRGSGSAEKYVVTDSNGYHYAGASADVQKKQRVKSRSRSRAGGGGYLDERGPGGTGYHSPNPNNDTSPSSSTSILPNETHTPRSHRRPSSGAMPSISRSRSPNNPYNRPATAPASKTEKPRGDLLDEGWPLRRGSSRKHKNNDNNKNSEAISHVHNPSSPLPPQSSDAAGQLPPSYAPLDFDTEVPTATKPPKKSKSERRRHTHSSASYVYGPNNPQTPPDNGSSDAVFQPHPVVTPPVPSVPSMPQNERESQRVPQAPQASQAQQVERERGRSRGEKDRRQIAREGVVDAARADAGEETEGFDLNPQDEGKRLRSLSRGVSRPRTGGGSFVAREAGWV